MDGDGEDTEVTVESWEDLIEPGSSSDESSNRGAPTPAATADAAPAPATEVDAAKPEPTTEAKSATPDPAATAADATKPAAVKAPEPVAVPVVGKPGEAKPAPAAKTDATAPDAKPGDKTPEAKATDATDETEDETEEDKAEFKDLPIAAQAPARRYRRESRQLGALKRDIGGEPFLEDARLIVPAFHQKAAPEFDEVLEKRSPQKRQELYTHHVYTALDTPADRAILVKELAQHHRAEVLKELGVEDKPGGQEPKSPQPAPATAPAPAQIDAANQSASLATIEELLTDPYITAEQTLALNAAKAAIASQQQTSTELAQMRTDLEALRATKAKDEVAPAIDKLKEETVELGGKFMGEVRAHVEDRLTALGLSVAEGDTAQIKSYIESERARIHDRMPELFATHETGGELASLLEEKFKRIPSLKADAKKAETDNAWRFLAAAKVTVENILEKEIATPLENIEARRRAQQVPSTTTEPKPRQELVGGDSPSSIPQPSDVVKGKGVDAVWDDILNPGGGFSRAASR